MVGQRGASRCLLVIRSWEFFGHCPLAIGHSFPSRMSSRSYKLSLLAVALLLVLGASQFQRLLNRQRSDPKLGLMRVTDLGTNAPPVLAFTTVALGGFRGLIANALWIRANDLQDEGKYFEMVQLADWITKLEPTFTQVWLVQSWNMAYNISVKFTEPADRWRWVQRGIELLRDNGLRYSPNEALVYRELAWFFQHKMGQNMDDAHNYYKEQWAKEMMDVLGSGHPDFDELLNPKTETAKKRAALLRDKYKMEPQLMKEVDQLYGPLEWRLPEAHAMYWATAGLQRAKKKDLITLRRVIYQCMQVSVLRGRLISLSPIYLGSDISKIDRANAAYEQMIQDDAEMRHAIKIAHKNFLKDAVYLLYTNDRLAEANRWFMRLKELYPDGLPANQSMEDWALEKVVGTLASATHDRTKAILEGVIAKRFLALAFNDEGQAEGYQRMARQIWDFYAATIRSRKEPLKFEPLPAMEKEILERLLGPESYFSPEMKARLQTQAEIVPAPASNSSTNAPTGKP